MARQPVRVVNFALQKDHVLGALKPVRQLLAAPIVLFHKLIQLLWHSLQASNKACKRSRMIMAPPAS